MTLTRTLRMAIVAGIAVSVLASVNQYVQASTLMLDTDLPYYTQGCADVRAAVSHNESLVVAATTGRGWVHGPEATEFATLDVAITELRTRYSECWVIARSDRRWN